uniref:Uncharacterized protein n=1 Tax=Arundo donax TaxID=35708 RepID=A0A0A9AWM5_ARUDO
MWQKRNICSRDVIDYSSKSKDPGCSNSDIGLAYLTSQIQCA